MPNFYYQFFGLSPIKTLLFSSFFSHHFPSSSWPLSTYILLPIPILGTDPPHSTNMVKLLKLVLFYITSRIALFFKAVLIVLFWSNLTLLISQQTKYHVYNSALTCGFIDLTSLICNTGECNKELKKD